MSVLPPGGDASHQPDFSLSQKLQELQEAVDKALEEQKEHTVPPHEAEEGLRSLGQRLGLHRDQVESYVQQFKERNAPAPNEEEAPQTSSAPSIFDVTKNQSSNRLDPLLKKAFGPGVSQNNLSGVPSELIALIQAFKNAGSPLAKDAAFQQIQQALTQGTGSTQKTQSASGPTPEQTKDWNQWKAAFLEKPSDGSGVGLMVIWDKSEGNGDITTSESMAYGMRMAVQNHDQATFDQLYAYAKHCLNDKGLMMWKVDGRGPGKGDPTWKGSATDADSDMAYALCEASTLWGNSSGKFDYGTEARTMIQNIKGNPNQLGTGDLYMDSNQEIQILPGNGWWNTGEQTFNASYVDPTEWATFAKFDSADSGLWNQLISNSLTKITNTMDSSTGLMPNFTGAGEYDPPFAYDACRVSMRLAQYYQYLSGLPSLTPAQKVQEQQISQVLSLQFNTFYNHPAPDGGIFAGYNLDGSPAVNYGGKACFNAPLALALNIMLKCKGINPEYCKVSQSDLQAFSTRLNSLVEAEVDKASQGPANNANYFDSCVGLLCMGIQNQ